MKILIFNTLYPTPSNPLVVGGAEKSVRNLAEGLAAKGHQVQSVYCSPPGSRPQTEEVGGVLTHALPLKNLYWPFDGAARSAVAKVAWHAVDDIGWGAHSALPILNSFAPDVVHTNNIPGLTSGIWSLARKKGVRIVHTLRDYSLMCAKGTIFRKGKTCETSCTDCYVLTANRRRRSAKIDAVVGLSNATIRHHQAVGLFARGVRTEVIGNISDATAPLPPRARDAGDPIVFGFIGRVTEDKGVEVLVNALARLPLGTASLVVAGRASVAMQERLKVLACGQSVIFLGFVSPKDFYSQIDVAVVPSLWEEPLSRAVIDAIGFRRPVIGSNRGGIPEYIGNPPFGWLFDPSDVDSLYSSMMEALSGNNSFVSPETKGDTISQYEEIYKG